MPRNLSFLRYESSFQVALLPKRLAHLEFHSRGHGNIANVHYEKNSFDNAAYREMAEPH